MEIKDIYDKYSSEQIDEFEAIVESNCCWGCEKNYKNKNCSDCELFFSERDKVVLLDYIEYLEKQNKEVRKQVCDEIREYLANSDDCETIDMITYNSMIDFLDQIEKKDRNYETK